MYQQLATYLTQYKQVTIPQVGSFELVPKPAMLDVASKIILPPGYLPQYSDKDFVKEHQLNFLALDLNTDKEIVREELENFGKDLKKRIQQGIFFWKGIGKLEAGEAAMVFYPDFLEIKGLQTIAAEKVLRKNVQHIVRRGEQEVVSSSFYEEEKPEIKERSITGLIGWVIVILSVFFIAFYLYRDGFKATASGTKLKVVPANTAPTHK